ncbi:hypothetical protein LCGC14_1277480 [marine sediment metagenome]|uniref:CARDB domain-containing protein n=1 Tax=marine sediment metagenome TaxID=412755 RepID=A0A0F9LHG7_9ZZZZ
MTTGRLGAVDLSATTNTLVYTVPASTIATVSINVANRNATPIAIRLAHLNGAIGTLGNEDYIEYDFVIPGNETLERTGIVMAATHTIVAYSDTANVSVQVYGWEELT